MLLMSQRVRAQYDQLPIPEQAPASNRMPQEGYPPIAPGPGGEDYSQPLPEYPDALGEPPWCESPYKNTRWRIALEFNPTTSKITDGGFGFGTDDSVLASRIVVDYEKPNGVGYRLQYWDFDETVIFPWGKLTTDASTLYLDVSKQFFHDDAELTFGGGLAAARLQLGRSSNQFIGAGSSVFGEGFYPFLRYEKTDLGVAGHVRFAVLRAFEEDVIHDRVAIIDDLGWGLELRHRYGAHLEKYWFVDALREFQFWGGISHPFAADEVFEGASFKFGIGW